LGGAAGHSGYFSTASDLLQYVRILGGYGKLSTGSRVFTEEVVKTFTTKVNVDYQSSMAYGFDTGCPGTIMKDCFGHHGSTGCSAWTDRATNISFGFVTNRGHPNVNNNLFWDYIPHIAD
jgi:CubicO group peptidase (beta-lactamase class C family)